MRGRGVDIESQLYLSTLQTFAEVDDGGVGDLSGVGWSPTCRSLGLLVGTIWSDVTFLIASMTREMRVIRLVITTTTATTFATTTSTFASTSTTLNGSDGVLPESLAALLKVVSSLLAVGALDGVHLTAQTRLTPLNLDVEWHNFLFPPRISFKLPGCVHLLLKLTKTKFEGNLIFCFGCGVFYLPFDAARRARDHHFL